MRRQTMRTVLFLLCLVGAAVSAFAQNNNPLVASTLRTSNTTANSVLVGCAAGSTSCTGGLKAGAVVTATADVTTSIANSTGALALADLVQITSTSAPQLSVRYDGSNRLDTTISSGGGVTFDAVGGSAGFSFSDATTFTSTTIMQGAAPLLKWSETGATANEGNWRVLIDSDTFALQTVNDAESASASIFSVSRTGTTVDSFTIGATQTIVPSCSGGGCVSAPTFALSGATNYGVMLGTTAGSFAVVGAGASVLSINYATGASTLNGALSVTVPSGGSVALAATSATGIPGLFDRAGGDGTILDFRSSGASQGSVSIAGATTSYNAFLGSHYTQLSPGQDAPEPGTVMVSTGRVIPARPTFLSRLTAAVPPEQVVDPPNGAEEKFVYTAPSTRRNQRAVYGVWFADLGRTAEGMSWGDPAAQVYQVAGVGLFPGVWVTDTCGPIETGMLLATSPVAGAAEAQCGANGRYDGTMRDYTLGKATIAVDWATVPRDADGVRKVRIPVVLTNAG